MTNFNGLACICGCEKRAGELHHVVYQQHLPRGGEERLDHRNLVPVAYRCHGAHHGRSKPLSLHVLPDSVYSFAAEVLGAGAAYEYLRRRYDGEDIRLERLLLEAAA